MFVKYYSESVPKYNPLHYQEWRCARKLWFLQPRQSPSRKTDQEVSDALNINNFLMREFVPPRPSLRYRQRGKNVLQRRPRPYREIVLIDHYFNHPNRNKRKRRRRKRKRPELAIPLFWRRWKQTKTRFVRNILNSSTLYKYWHKALF